MANECLAPLQRVSVRKLVDALKPLALDRLWQLVWPVRCRGSRARRVGRCVHHVEAHCAHKLQRALELLLCLAGEPDDRVGGEAGLRDLRVDTLNDLQVPRGGVTALHAPQDLIAASLERDVELLAYRWRIPHSPDQVVRDVPRMRREETDALDAVHVADVSKQVCEGAPRLEVPAPGVDVLPQERYLPEALGRQLLDLAPHGLHGPRLLTAARGRHHAIGAPLVAAVDHVNPGRDPRLAVRHRQVLHDARFCGRADLATCQRLVQHIREPVGVLRPHHGVDLRHLAQECLALLLRHAAADHDGHVVPPPLPLYVRVEPRVDLLFGFVTDRASVQNDNSWILDVALRGPPQAQ
mmetsp:Transcript_114579/g.319063  ORF Transcript_114579/g.319063 Transcript_114579/m.319063 type:complete len:353 (-) Transcript_114579:479-1537(-)